MSSKKEQILRWFTEYVLKRSSSAPPDPSIDEISPSQDEDIIIQTLRVTRALTCPKYEPLKQTTGSAKISDGVFLDEDLKGFFEIRGLLEQFPIFSEYEIIQDVKLTGEIYIPELKTKFVIIGHPDILSKDLRLVADIKQTSTYSSRYPSEPILFNIDIAQRYIDQVKLYKWLIHKTYPHIRPQEIEGYLLGRVTINWNGKAVEKWFFNEVPDYFTDETLHEFLLRIPRYEYECNFCKYREMCEHSTYTPDDQKNIKLILHRIAKYFGIKKIKSYKGWRRFFKDEIGLVYSDGYIWRVEPIGRWNEIIGGEKEDEQR